MHIKSHMKLAHHRERHESMVQSKSEADETTVCSHVTTTMQISDAVGYAAEIANVIAKYNQNPVAFCSFSIGGVIDTTIGVPAVHIVGLDRVAFPLCNAQMKTVVSVSSSPVPYRQKENHPGLDANACNTWKIDNHSVQLNTLWLTNSLPRLVSQFCAKLGINSAETTVRPTLQQAILQS